MIWMTFIEILKYTIHIKNEIHWSCLMIDYCMLSNKKINPIVTELFIR